MVATFQTNFSRGKLSTKIRARIDTQAYQDGAKELTNMLVSLQGGAITRPGSRTRARIGGGTPVAATGLRLERMIVDRDEAYILAFSNARLDVYRLTADDITLSQTLTSQPWDATTMWFMSVEVYGSLAFVMDNSFRTRLITRTGLDTFTSEALTFQTRVDGLKIYEPYHKFADRDLTLSFTAYAVGTGETCTASDDFFVAGHVGLRFRVRDGEIEITGVTNPTTATVDIIREIRTVLDPNPFATHNGTTRITCTFANHGLSLGDTVNFDNTGDSGETVTGANIDGDRTVTEVIDEDHFTFTCGGTASDSVDFGGSDVWCRTAGATVDWKEPAFSTVRGWPQTGQVHQGRLWLGGSTSLRDDRWGSVAGNFFSFDQGDGGPSDAVKAVGEAGGGNIRHLVSGQDLEVFSDVRESFIPSADQPIEQSNVRGRPQTAYGAAYTPPVQFDGSTLFVDAVGQHVREYVPGSDNQGNIIYVAPPVTALASDVINQPYHATTYDGASEEATPYAIFTNTDGSAAFYHGSRQEKIAGWTPHTSGGAYESFAGVNERLFAGTTRGTEMFIEEWDFDYIARADACENLTDAGTTSWTVTWDYLKSKTVDVFDSNGVYLEQTTTDASGNFSTTASQTDIWVGLPATWTLETLPPAFQLPRGPLTGRRTAIAEAVVSLIETTKVKVGRTTKTFSTPFTGLFQSRKFGWSRDPTIPLSGTIANKATVAGIRAEVN